MQGSPTQVTIYSWGCQYGDTPGKLDLTMDVDIDGRGLKDPERERQRHDGRSTEVIVRMLQSPQYSEVAGLMGRMAAEVLQSGRPQISIGVYSTAGKHRSRAMARVLAASLRQAGRQVRAIVDINQEANRKNCGECAGEHSWRRVSADEKVWLTDPVLQGFRALGV